MRVPAILLCLLAAMPGAVAWSFHGDAEPSTAEDLQGGYMWPDSGDDAGPRIYFNVVAEASSTGQNPNDALVGATVPNPDPTFVAYLGVWRDCNHDGYLGAAAGAFLEYRPELAAASGHPLDTRACPFGSPWNNDGGNPNPTLAPVGIESMGGLVTELLWIGPADWSPRPGDITYQIPHLVSDPFARVWGDFGLPGDAPSTTCAAWPLPRGTTASTGGALAFASCYDASRTAAQLPVPDVHAPVSLFGDPGSGRAGLLQRGSGEPAARVWDCSAPHDTQVTNPGPHAIDLADPEPASVEESLGLTPWILSGSKGLEGVAEITVFADDPGGGSPRFHRDVGATLATAPRVGSPMLDPSGSAYDAAMDLELGLVEACDPRVDPLPMASLGPGPILGKPPMPEDDVRGVDPLAGRRGSDIVFDFQQMKVSNQEGGTLPQGNLGFPFVGDFMGHGFNTQDAGVAYLRDVNGNGPGWRSLAASATGPRVVHRDQVVTTAASYATFYAHVEVAGYALPGATGNYGAEACGAIGEGASVVNGWDCDPTHWWNVALGAPANPKNRFSQEPLGVVPGAAYELRDVDALTRLPATPSPP